MSAEQTFLAPEATRHLVSLFPPPYPVMARIEREAEEEGQPAVGRSTGSVLRMLAAAVGARRVLEVGTNIGYSALWLASALPQGGVVETIEVNEDLARRAEANAREAGVGDRVRLLVGEALAVMPRLQGPYDLVFLDAMKDEYPAYLDHALRLLRPGGVVAADNVFWLGQAWDPSADDEDTRGIREYTRRATTDPRLVTTLVPSEDGLMVSVVRPPGGAP